jgi:hypothetical protein
LDFGSVFNARKYVYGLDTISTVSSFSGLFLSKEFLVVEIPTELRNVSRALGRKNGDQKKNKIPNV